MVCGFQIAALLLAATFSPGCLVRVYQPMSGYRPVVTDMRHPNFTDTAIDVHCIPGDALTESQAGVLCQKVQTLFENQGAAVRTHLSAGVVVDELVEEEVAPVEGDEAAPLPEAPRPTALTVQLRTRKVHESSHTLSWILCLGSFTILPGLFETTFAQDVVVRDGTGFLLVEDSMEGRIVTRFGFGSWLGNALLDIQRPKDERILGETVSKHLSGDLYKQLTQIVFNAKMHAEVLEQASLRAAP